MDYLSLQKRLKNAVDRVGLKANSISRKTGIDTASLSRFKNGKGVLSRREAETLEKYLDDFFMISL